jgi:uncharacterized protein (TIGR01619 family)
LADDWDFYFARIDDVVSSIHVNLGLAADAPNEKQPWLLRVRVDMRAPRPDGLASAEETGALSAIEDALDSMVSAVCGAQFVGRITGASQREFFFYANEPGELDACVARALKPFEGYVSQADSTFEPGWDHYLRALYPSATNLQRMFNRRVLESLAAEGDVHETPRQVQHLFRLPSAEARDACRETLVAIDFAVDFEEQADEAEAADWPFLLGVSRVDSIEPHTINGITIEFARLAAQNGGDYDGWECAATPAADS